MTGERQRLDKGAKFWIATLAIVVFWSAVSFSFCEASAALVSAARVHGVMPELQSSKANARKDL